MCRTCFVVLFLVCHVALSQHIVPRFETLGINDGLPHSSVYNIYQDKKGFMWFGTPDGLCRYDGSLLESYKYEAVNKTDVVNNFIKGGFFEDKHHNIWYSNESGIFKWNVLTEKIEKVISFTKNMFQNSGLQSIFMDENECLWIVNIIKGVYEFNTKTKVLNRYPLPTTYAFNYKAMVLSQSYRDTEGNIWLRVLVKNDPFIRFDHKTKQYSIHFKKNPPHSIFFEKNRQLLCYDDKIVFVDTKTNKQTIVKKTVNDKPVSFYSVQCIKDRFNRYWFSSRGSGLYCYDEKNNIFKHYDHDNSKLKSLPFDITTSFFIDKSDNLWVGIDGGGVARLDLNEPKFNIFPLSEGYYPILKDYFTKCFYEDEKANIWFGTHTSGLNIYNTISGNLQNFQHKEGDNKSLPGNIVGGILKDSHGNTWIGSSGGISLFNSVNKDFYTLPIRNLPHIFPKINVFVYKIIELKNGAILAATLWGLVKITGNKQHGFTAFYISDSAFAGNSLDVLEMEDKSVYVARPNIGLLHLKPYKNSYLMDTLLLPGIDIRSIRKDETNSNYLWIATGIGLLNFNIKDASYTMWDEKDKLPNSYVYGSLEDAKHNLWISTNKGLCYFNRSNNSFEGYSFLDGLQSNEFNTQAFYKGSSGTFYFGGIRGFNWFKPKNNTNITLKPVATITRIDINDIPYQKTFAHFYNENIEAPFNKNYFNIRFAALDYTRPETNKIQYTLDGWDTKWITTYNKSVRYSKLPPGNYTFKIRVANAYNIWSEEEKVFIHIKAPFLQQKWFYFVSSILLLCIIIYITYLLSQLNIKKQLRVLESQRVIDAERNRISRDMHDEIGSGLTQIALLSELIQTQQKAEAEIKKDVGSISAAARKLVESMSEIIWALNPQNDTLESMLSYTREQMQQHFQPFDLVLNINFPEMVPTIKLTNEQRRNLYLVTKEALNNALKHSQASNIVLSCTINKNNISFIIIDNGIGLSDKTQKTFGNGLKNMRKRIVDIGGQITFINSSNGLTVSYTLNAQAT